MLLTFDLLTWYELQCSTLDILKVPFHWLQMADSTWREKIGAILCSVSEVLLPVLESIFTSLIALIAQARNSANERKKKLKSEFASLVNNKLHCNVPILELPLLVKVTLPFLPLSATQGFLEGRYHLI